MNDDEEIGYTLTPDGLKTAIDMHGKILAGWTIEQVAAYYEMETLAVQVVLVILYHAAEANGIDIVVVPDTIEGLDTTS